MRTQAFIENLTLDEAVLDAENRTARQVLIRAGRSANGRVYSAAVLEQAAREVGDRRSGGDTEMTLHHDAAPSGYTYDEWRQLPLAERIRLCGPTGGAPLALPAGPGAAHEGSVDVLG